MEPQDDKPKRWQFGLKDLFLMTSVVAVMTAAVTGGLGEPVRDYVLMILTMLLVTVAGLIYYLLLLLLIASPMLVSGWFLYGVSRAIRARDADKADG